MCCFSRLSPAKNISKCVKEWAQVGAPDYILSWIKDGITLPFNDKPEKFVLPNRDFSSKEKQFIDNELQRLVANGSIVQCSNDNLPQCISPISCVPKKNKKLRLITDLRVLNQHCCKRSFQYEDIKSVLDCVQPS